MDIDYDHLLSTNEKAQLEWLAAERGWTLEAILIDGVKFALAASRHTFEQQQTQNALRLKAVVDAAPDSMTKKEILVAFADTKADAPSQ